MSVKIKPLQEVKIGGISGWSLPTLDELQVLRNRRDEFGIAEKYCYWSSERKGKNDAFYVHFDDGHLGNSPKSYNNGLCAIFTKTKKLSKDKSQFYKNLPEDLSVVEILVLDELRNKPDVFWTNTNIEESIKINRPEFQQYFGNIQKAIRHLIYIGFLKIDDNKSISATLKAIKYYRTYPRYYKTD